MSETLWSRVWWKWVRKGAPREEAAYRADEAMRRYTLAQDRRGYDRNGPEVSCLHHWFADNGQQWKWYDDGCRSEQARDLLNYLAKHGLIIVPVPAKDRLFATRDDVHRLAQEETKTLRELEKILPEIVEKLER